MAAAIIACVVPPLRRPVLAAEDADLAAAVKATYLYKFAAFIRWPSPATEFPGDVFPLCVVGNGGGFPDVLERAVRGQTVEGHAIVTRSLPSLSGNPACAVIYAAAAPSSVVETVRDKPILTVTDEASGPGPKGIINFVVRDNRVRFEIDENAAAAAGLGISSKLLALAVSFRPGSR